MEPNTPDMNTNSAWTPQPTKPWQRAPKFYLLGGLAALVLIVVGIIALVGGSDKGSNKGAQADKLYYDRPGFDRSKLSTGIGDPAALRLEKTAQAVSYGGVPVVQACNVLSPADITQAGLQLQPHNMPTAFERTYFDGQGTGVLRPSSSLPSLGEANDCRYNVTAAGATYMLWVEVFQPPYAGVQALNEAISGLPEVASVSGLKTYQTAEQSASLKTTTTLMRSGDSAVRITTTLEDAAASRAVLERVAANLSRLLNAPDGPPKAVIKSPLLPEGVVNACELLLPADIQTVFNESAGPTVHEAATTAVGIIRPDRQDTTRYNYAQHECERSTVLSEADAFNLNKRQLRLEVTTYRVNEGAEKHMALYQARGHNESLGGVGDQAFLSTTGSKKSLTVRRGKVVFTLSNSDKQGNQQTLQSLSQTIADRL